MKSLELVRRLHAHRAWVNRRLLAAADSLEPNALKQSLPIGQGSVWKSLVHLHAAEFVWLAALQGRETATLPGDVPDKLPGNQEGADGIRSLAELQSRWQELDARWQKYLDGLAEESLDEWVWKVSSNGRRTGTKRADVLLHVCTHAHYTTAQVVNMLRQLGAKELPDPMLITLARQEAAEQP